MTISEDLHTREPRRYCTLGIDLRGAECLVVGGGPIGMRKAKTLSEVGARVTVVAPSVCQDMWRWMQAAAVRYREAAYDESMLNGMWFVVAATSDAEINLQIARDAVARRVLCCVASSAEASQVIFPATWSDGETTLAVHTHGRNCAAAKRIRDTMVQWFRSWHRSHVKPHGSI